MERNLRPLLELFKKRNCKEEFISYIEENQEDWKMGSESWFMFSQLSHFRILKRLIREKNQEVNMIEKEEGEEKSMLKALDDLIYDAKIEGRAESLD